MRNGRSKCDLCPSTVTNTFRIVGFSILVLCVIYLLIWFNIWKTKESEFSILFKILTNYLQTATAAMSFNITYPQFIKTIFTPAQFIGSSTDVILSFDCFINDFKINFFSQSQYIMKSFVSCVIPVFIATFFILIFVVWKLIWRSKSSLKRNTTVVLITVIFFLHPSLTEKAFSFLRCVDIYETSRMLFDLEIKCWKGTHTYWAGAFAIPMVVICFLIPTIALVWMLLNRKN